MKVYQSALESGRQYQEIEFFAIPPLINALDQTKQKKRKKKLILLMSDLT